MAAERKGEMGEEEEEEEEGGGDDEAAGDVTPERERFLY